MRARAASSRTRTATITGETSDLGYMAYGHCPYDVGRPGRSVLNVSREPSHPTGAIHVPHDSLRRPHACRCFRRLLELGDRADRSAEVHRHAEWRDAVVRLVGLH